MSIELCILASGSSGNCAVVRTPDGVVLIDAGIGPRTTAKRMAGSGVTVGDIRAICLTHLDRDHFALTWFETLVQRGIRLFCHQSRAEELRFAAADAGLPVKIETFNGHPFQPIDRLTVQALRFDHDRTGSHGFLIDGFDGRMGYATDLGRVPDGLLEQFCGTDLVALESNYDPQMQLQSDRPVFLKQRIMGGRGHLSNQQAFEAIQAILDRCERAARRLPRHIVLLHRSRQCNCPKLLRTQFETDPRIAQRLTLAEPFERTKWLAVRDRQPLFGEQLCLPL